MGLPARKQQQQQIKFFRPWLVSAMPNAAGEYRMRCPIHDDTNASATINFDKGLFHCNTSKCIGGCTISTLRDKMNAKGIETNGTTASGQSPDVPSEKIVQRYHEYLLESAEELEAFIDKRGLTIETIKQFQLGLDFQTKRIVIPIRDAAGRIVNLRKYSMSSDDSTQKMINQTGLGSPPRLFPISELDNKEATVFVVEGELDALRLIQEGVLAVSGTGGAKKWVPEWTDALEGREVVILYDNDADGRMGAAKAAKALEKKVAGLVVSTELVNRKGGDATDFFNDGGTLEDLVNFVGDLPPFSSAVSLDEDEEALVETEAVTTSVIGTMDSRTNGKALTMQVTVSGRKDPTYSVPGTVDLSCTLDAGPKCAGCPMADAAGDMEVSIKTSDISFLAKFINAPESAQLDLIRGNFGIHSCSLLRSNVTQHHTVQELFVKPPIDSDGEDMTQRRVYTIGDSFSTKTNTVSNLTGTTWPNPKDARNEFYAWGVEEAITSLDSFVITDSFVERMQQFCPDVGQSPLEKAREIAHNNSIQVTHIFGRERLHMAMDLAFHSIISFPFQNGRHIQRGWVEFIVVGDTRTGKSETALELSKHYGAGHVISCENASVAGLVGGATQIGNQWTLQWGEYTLNDRRLAILDEVSGMPIDVVSAMTQVRSSGIAQITKIATDQTRARVRSIWISNPRKSNYIDEQKQDGIDVLEDVIGSQEDIARFDLAMSVKEKDVKSSQINRLVSAEEPKYSRPDCRELVLWAWSRKPDDVVWGEGALEYVFEMADRIGRVYVSKPPLIEIASVKEKIARLAVALAARTFSSDRTGTKVIVEKQHVKDVCVFMNELYSYENFGYRRRSKRVKRNNKIARSHLPAIRKWLTENKTITDFLIDINGSFRLQDMAEMAGVDIDRAREAINILSRAKMVQKVKSQIVQDPILQTLLREFE